MEEEAIDHQKSSKHGMIESGKKKTWHKQTKFVDKWQQINTIKLPNTQSRSEGIRETWMAHIYAQPEVENSPTV